MKKSPYRSYKGNGEGFRFLLLFVAGSVPLHGLVYGSVYERVDTFALCLCVGLYFGLTTFYNPYFDFVLFVYVHLIRTLPSFTYGQCTHLPF